MARPQAFDQQQVLEQAMRLFWRQGYTNTSIKDLTQVTKLQPGSLYGAFKNKRQLFQASLDLYFEKMIDQVQQRLVSDQPPLQRIRAFFDFLIRRALLDEEHKSCLMVNTLLETPIEDNELHLALEQKLGKIEQMLRQVLEQAQADGSLKKQSSPQILATLLMNQVFGLNVYNRMKPDETTINQIVDQLFIVLQAD